MADPPFEIAAMNPAGTKFRHVPATRKPAQACEKETAMTEHVNPIGLPRIFLQDEKPS